jgi:type I restriction enzyme S subunit
MTGVFPFSPLAERRYRRNPMPNTWPLVPLGGVLRQRSEFARIDDLQTYKRVRVQLHAKGIVSRDVVPGAEIKTKEQQVCQAGELLVAEIDAKVGGFGIVPADLAGAIVSSHYFLFEVDESAIDKRFLDFFVRTPYFQDQIHAQGSTNYAAIRPTDVLIYQIPLPPLEEQGRIVARLDQLAAKIQEARHLQEETELDLRRILVGAYSEITANAPRLPMAEVAPLVRRPVKVNLEDEYPELGIRSFGKGTFHKASITGAALGKKRIFKIEAGDLLFNIVFAWEGAVAVARKEDAGRVGSHRFLTCVPKQGPATSGYLCFHFLTGQGLEDLGRASPGGAGRNRTLGLEALAKINVPAPSYEKQLWFDDLQARVDTLKRLQAETAAELDALLPSILDRAFRGEL